MARLTLPSLKAILGADLPRIRIMDIGAMEEGRDRYAPLVANGLADVVGFEPRREEFERLSLRSGPYTYLNVALGDGARATLHVTRAPSASSLRRPDSKYIDAFSDMSTKQGAGGFSVEEEIEVDTIRLDDLENVEQPDLIKIDVQGTELDVLLNGPRTVANSVIIECEVEFVPLYEGQPLFGDVQVYLRSKGFVLHKLIDLAGRALRPVRVRPASAPFSQVLWADAVFVRDFSDLMALDDAQLLRAATILHDVYRSYDLARYFLDEHDRRTSTSYAERYDAALSSGQLPPPLFVSVRK